MMNKITEINEQLDKLINSCVEIQHEHDEYFRQDGFRRLIGTSDGRFLHIYKQAISIITQIGYTENDLNNLFTHGINPKEKLDSLYIIHFINFLKSIRNSDNVLCQHQNSKSLYPIDILERILINFHRFARQILIRHLKRDSIEIKDEYDVQDLLHAILELHFDDVREEEYTPSYAGMNSRMDFFINDYGIAVEVKKTSKSLKDKEIGAQLLVDISRYQTHKNIKTLICFVYDPDGFIRKPIGLGNDLMKASSNLEVKVIICPKF